MARSVFIPQVPNSRGSGGGKGGRGRRRWRRGRSKGAAGVETGKEKGIQHTANGREHGSHRTGGKSGKNKEAQLEPRAEVGDVNQICKVRRNAGRGAETGKTTTPNSTYISLSCL